MPPHYDYFCKKCDHEFSEWLDMDNRKIPTESPCEECGGSVEQMIGTSATVDSVRLEMSGVHRNSGDFKEVISKIKEAHPRNTIKDYS